MWVKISSELFTYSASVEEIYSETRYKSQGFLSGGHHSVECPTYGGVPGSYPSAIKIWQNTSCCSEKHFGTFIIVIFMIYLFFYIVYDCGGHLVLSVSLFPPLHIIGMWVGGSSSFSYVHDYPFVGNHPKWQSNSMPLDNAV